MRTLLLLALTAAIASAQPPAVQRFLIPRQVEEEKDKALWEPYTEERQEPRLVYRRETRKIKEWRTVYVRVPVEREEERVVYRRETRKVPRVVLVARQEESLTPAVVYRPEREAMREPRPVYIARDAERVEPRVVYRQEPLIADVHIIETLPTVEKGKVAGWTVRRWDEVRQLREHVPRVEAVKTREKEYTLETRLLPAEKRYESGVELIRARETRYREEVREVEEVEYVARVERVKVREAEYRPEWREVEREVVEYVPRVELITVRETLYRPAVRKAREPGVVYGERVETTTVRPRPAP